MDFQMMIHRLEKIKTFQSEIFKQLKDDTDETVALKILARFFVTLEESLNLIQDSLKQGQWLEISRSCHKISGSADLVGLKVFAERSRQLSKDAKILKNSPQEVLYQEVDQYLRQGFIILDQLKKSFPDHANYA